MVVLATDLEDHMHEQSETVLARVLAGYVSRREIDEIGSGLGTDGVDQHLLTSTSRSG